MSGPCEDSLLQMRSFLGEISVDISLNLKYVLVTAEVQVDGPYAYFGTLVSFLRFRRTGTYQTTSDSTQNWRFIESCLTPHRAHLLLVDPVPGPLLMRGRVKYRSLLYWNHGVKQ